MTRFTLSNALSRAIRFVAIFSVLSGTGETAFGAKIKLTLQDGPLTILKDNVATKKIYGIPGNTPGVITIHFKWHAMTFVPNTFVKLKVEVLRGSTVMRSDTCYSIHAISTPRCTYVDTLTPAEAEVTGDWKLRITNNSAHDVNGFNIEKEATELNPAFLTIAVESTFEPDCTIRDLSVYESTLAPKEKKTLSLSFPNLPGEIRIKAKWHVDTLVPFFNPASMRLLRNGEVVRSDSGYSIHSDQKDKLEITFNVVPLANGPSTWQLEVTNTGPVNIKGFGIQKGNDLNPLVPQFKSTFTPTCN